MSFSISSSFKTSVSIAAVTSLLILGGCKGGDKGATSNSKVLSAFNLSKADGNTFAPYFELGTCNSNEQEALGALAGLGLGENGDEGITFSNRVADGATITYSDLKIAEGELISDLWFNIIGTGCPDIHRR